MIHQPRPRHWQRATETPNQVRTRLGELGLDREQVELFLRLAPEQGEARAALRVIADAVHAERARELAPGQGPAGRRDRNALMRAIRQLADEYAAPRPGAPRA